MELRVALVAADTLCVNEIRGQFEQAVTQRSFMQPSVKNA
ncbi:MAG: hypothetical protein RL385_1712 [Pseudomonadota bacterium]|jgi:hypothetical protein